MNWKKRLGGSIANLNDDQKQPEIPETKEVLESKRDQLWFKSGQHQFTKAVVEAELLQMNQEILRINNALSKLPRKDVKPDEPSKIEPILRVVEPEVVI